VGDLLDGKDKTVLAMNGRPRFSTPPGQMSIEGEGSSGDGDRLELLFVCWLEVVSLLLCWLPESRMGGSALRRPLVKDDAHTQDSHG